VDHGVLIGYIVMELRKVGELRVDMKCQN